MLNPIFLLFLWFFDFELTSLFFLICIWLLFFRIFWDRFLDSIFIFYSKKIYNKCEKNIKSKTKIIKITRNQKNWKKSFVSKFQNQKILFLETVLESDLAETSSSPPNSRFKRSNKSFRPVILVDLDLDLERSDALWPPLYLNFFTFFETVWKSSKSAEPSEFSSFDNSPWFSVECMTVFCRYCSK